jgi:uncharacterized protein YqhQ
MNLRRNRSLWSRLGTRDSVLKPNCAVTTGSGFFCRRYNGGVNIGKHFRLLAHIQLMPALENGEETTLVGGQAVMEGVMMRAPHSYCTAVRKPNGEIVTEEYPIHRMSEKYPLLKLPVLRGLGLLGQAMMLGVKALKFSANHALDEGKTDEKPVEITSKMMAGNLAVSLLGFIFLYKFIPLFLATRLGHAVPALSSRFAVNMSDGVIRMVMFFTFLFLLSLMPDMRRVFQYHGAEHKVVFNFESGKPVNVENAQKFVTFHPRCGTSFLFVVLGIAMITYAFVRRAHRSAAADRRRQLRSDPLRRAPPGDINVSADDAWIVATTHHHEASGRFAGSGRNPRS